MSQSACELNRLQELVLNVSDSPAYFILELLFIDFNSLFLFTLTKGWAETLSAISPAFLL